MTAVTPDLAARAAALLVAIGRPRTDAEATELLAVVDALTAAAAALCPAEPPKRHGWHSDTTPTVLSRLEAP